MKRPLNVVALAGVFLAVLAAGGYPGPPNLYTETDGIQLRLGAPK